MCILGKGTIKEHFQPQSPPPFIPPTLEWLFLGVSSQNKISKKFFRNAFPYGSDILTLNSLKYPLMYIYIYIYICVCVYIYLYILYIYIYMMNLCLRVRMVCWMRAGGELSAGGCIELSKIP